MGYGHYVLPGETEPRGYEVEATCQHPGCEEKIDKGLGCLCYGCGGYFCDSHLGFSVDPLTDKLKEFTCFAGTRATCCDSCGQ